MSGISQFGMLPDSCRMDAATTSLELHEHQYQKPRSHPVVQT